MSSVDTRSTKLRFNYAKAAPGVYDAMDALDRYLAECGLEESLLHLVRLRASQINGCAYCLDMHWKDLRALGESEQRLYSLDAWGESPLLHRARAGGAGLDRGGDADRRRAGAGRGLRAVRPQFDDKEMSDLTLAVSTINAWNRLSIAARLTPGGYQPAAVAGPGEPSDTGAISTEIAPVVSSLPPGSDVEIAHVLRVPLDELPPRLDLVAHQLVEQLRRPRRRPPS